jgi:hypothetical protein
MRIEVTTRKMYEVTTRQMYDTLFATFKDAFWDSVTVDSEPFLAAAKALSRGDMNGIRNAFIQGYTPMLLGERMAEYETLEVKEILVRHGDGVIGVLVECEIDY